jgi:hypothetical protein
VLRSWSRFILVEPQCDEAQAPTDPTQNLMFNIDGLSKM